MSEALHPSSMRLIFCRVYSV